MESDSSHSGYIIGLCFDNDSREQFYVKIFDNYSAGWAESSMVEHLLQHCPNAARFKLIPLVQGPCIVSLGSSSDQSLATWFALYPITGTPVDEIPTSVDINMSFQEICTAAMEHIDALKMSGMNATRPCAFSYGRALSTPFIVDIPSKCIWMTNFQSSEFSWQDWTGTYTLSPVRLRALQNTRGSNEPANQAIQAAHGPLDLSSSSLDYLLAALLDTIHGLATFPNNSAKTPKGRANWKKLISFCSPDGRTEETHSLQKCSEFFSQFGVITETIFTGHTTPNMAPPNAYRSSMEIDSHSATMSTATTSSTLSWSSRPEFHSPPKSSPLSRLTTLDSTMSRGAASTMSSISLPRPASSPIGSTTSTRTLIQDFKTNPVVVLNGHLQKLTGSSPQFIDEGRKGGHDHNPRFGCSLVLPGGQKLYAEGSSKQDAKANVSSRALELLLGEGAV